MKSKSEKEIKSSTKKSTPAAEDAAKKPLSKTDKDLDDDDDLRRRMLI